MNQAATKETTDLMGGSFFSYPKPVTFLKGLVNSGTVQDNEDTILDFFSGSATTAHAVMQLNAEDGGNRKFIMVQLPEKTAVDSEAFKAGYKNICEIGKKRIRRAGKKIAETSQLTAPDLDTGFKVFKLDSTNPIIWNNTYTEDHQELLKRIKQQSLFYIKDDRSDFDLVTEIMLKNGRPLTDKITEIKVRGVNVFLIENPDYKILICLEPNITRDQPGENPLIVVEAMLSDLPVIDTFIFADRCFADANEIINTREILKKEDRDMRLF